MARLQLAVPPPLAPADTLFSDVVLGIDFSAASLAAARWATSHVARRANAIASHVAPESDDAHSDADGRPARTATFGHLSRALIGGLSGFAATLDVSTARQTLRFGRPSHWLSTITNRSVGSLLVLGRRADASRVHIGEPNVIERTARLSDASVLVVPESATQPPRHIVAAIDESPFAAKVLRTARWLARVHEIPLIVLHVVSPAIAAYERLIRTSHSGRGVRVRSADTDVPAAAVRWFTDFVRTHGLSSRDTTEVTMGDPARELIAAAKANEASLLVVGKRGADDAPVRSIGSVARELITRAPVPVLALTHDFAR